MMALHEVCNVCDRKSHDKSGKFEDVITCSCCGEISHYSCLNLPKKVLQVITSYPWQCTACKTCEVCRSGKCEKKLLCCDGCDRSYHTFCLTPRLARLPRVREWLCSNCKLKYDSDTTTAAWSKTTSSPCSTQKPRRRLSLQTTSRKLGEPSVSSPGRFRRAVSLQDTLTKDRGSSAVSSSNTSDELPLHEKSKEKRKRRLESSSELSNDLCERKIIKLEDFDTVQEDKDHVKPERTPEKRKDVQTALGEVTPKSGGRVCKYRKSCPTPGCDGSGHSSGMLFSHHTKSGCPLLHGNSPAKQQGQKKRHFEKKLPQSPESRRRSQRKLIPISNKSDLTHRLKVSIPSLPKSFAESYSKGRQTVKLSSEDNRVDTPESTKPISSSYQTKTVFTKEEEEKLKNLVTEYDFNMFMNAREKAAKMVGTVEPTSTSCNVRRIELGKYDIDAWYSSPYPQEYFHLPKVYVCEFCLKYMKSSTILRRHMAKCTWRYPPGDEIYRKGNISFFEVNGKTEKTYCQNLCLLAKLFLDHKTLYYDVEPFLFYVLTQRDNTGCHLIGYFSKEKKSRLNYNVSCILCLPPYMRRGFGKMLVAFSYLLSRKEGKTGSPERPLSDLGLISYRSYWKEILLGFLKDNREDCVCIKDISFLTGINTADIISTFQYLGMLKYWKGSHIILKCEDLLKEYEEKARSRPPDYATIDESCLKWIPPDKRSDES